MNNLEIIGVVQEENKRKFSHLFLIGIMMFLGGVFSIEKLAFLEQIETDYEPTPFKKELMIVDSISSEIENQNDVVEINQEESKGKISGDGVQDVDGILMLPLSLGNKSGWAKI